MPGRQYGWIHQLQGVLRRVSRGVRGRLKEMSTKGLAVAAAILASGAILLIRYREERPAKRASSTEKELPGTSPPRSGQRINLDLAAAGPERHLEEDRAALSRVEIHTIDESGNALPRVSILIVNDASVVLLGVTDERGALEARLDTSGAPKVEARLTGYATSARSIDASTEALVLRMKRAVPIRGRVHKHDESGAGSGIKVLALPAGEVWDAAFFARCARQNPPRHVAVTDEESRYTIEDANADATYLLFAAGNGLLGGPLPGVEPQEGRSFDLVVTPVYGACVAFSTESGAPVYSPDMGFNEYFEHIDFFSAEAIPLGPWTSSAFLLGLGRDAFDAPSMRLLLFLPKDHGFDGSALGPVFYKTTFPGYGDTETVVWAEPFSSDLPMYTVVHASVGVSLGSIEVQLVEHGAGQGVLLHQGAGAFATLQLISRSPEGRDLEIELEHLYDGKETVDGIPQGEYSARVVFQNGSYSWPGVGAELESTIRVSETPFRILIDTRELSHIMLDVRWPDGTPYMDSLTVDLGEGEPHLLSDGSVRTSGGNSITFRKGPFLIKGLVPSTYSVKIRRPLSAQPDYRPVVVSTTAGETTPLLFVMKDEH